jgi:hypothetical protein
MTKSGSPSDSEVGLLSGPHGREKADLVMAESLTAVVRNAWKVRAYLRRDSGT